MSSVRCFYFWFFDLIFGIWSTFNRQISANISTFCNAKIFEIHIINLHEEKHASGKYPFGKMGWEDLKMGGKKLVERH